jgi:hypothetical protein
MVTWGVTIKASQGKTSASRFIPLDWQAHQPGFRMSSRQLFILDGLKLPYQFRSLIGIAQITLLVEQRRFQALGWE